MHYYVTTGSGKNKRAPTRTRWSRASGASRGSSGMCWLWPASLCHAQDLRALEPWTLSELTPYCPTDFLSAFAPRVTWTCPRYEIGKDRMGRHFIRSDISRHGAAMRAAHRQPVPDYADERFKHLLLPIGWRLIRTRGKSYRFIVNWPIGPAEGERPIRVEESRCGNIGRWFSQHIRLLMSAEQADFRGMAMSCVAAKR